MCASQSGLWNMGKGEFEESVRAIEVAIVRRGGDPRQIFDHFRTNGDFTDRVAEFMIRGGVEASTHQKLARAIMGKNFFGAEEWSEFYGVSFSEEKLQKLAEFPWSEGVLNAPCPFVKGKSIRETHFAFLGLDAIKGRPLTILRWPEIQHGSGSESSGPHLRSSLEWYSDDQVFEEVCDFRWYLMPLEIIPGSMNKKFEEQVVMFPLEYQVPLAIEEVSKHILYYRKNGICLNSKAWGWCQDLVSGDNRVMVGLFDTNGLGLSAFWSADCNPDLGVAVSREPWLRTSYTKMKRKRLRV